jgi:hypothetical protein
MNRVEAAVRRLHSSFVPLARQAETLLTPTTEGIH